MRGRVLPLAALAGALALAACRGEETPAAEPPGPPRMDTTNAEALDGMSTRELEAAARGMSPEEAAARGIVDTTIHVENLGVPDSLPPGTGPYGPAGPQRPRPDSARRDTAPPPAP